MSKYYVKSIKYYCFLYTVTLILMATLDVIWLRVIAREFYESRIGSLLEFHLLPALLFYLVYITGIIVFVSGSKHVVAWRSVAFYSALFGCVAYATYDLTNMATLHGWSWSVVIVDIAWGIFNTAFSATNGWLIANIIRRM